MSATDREAWNANDRAHGRVNPTMPEWKTRWRPVRIGIFYYAMRGADKARGNHVMREACAAQCARLNAESDS